MGKQLSDFHIAVSGLIEEKDKVSSNQKAAKIKDAEKKIAKEIGQILTNPMQDINDETEIDDLYFYLMVLDASFEIMLDKGNTIKAMQYRNEFRLESDFLGKKEVKP